MLRYSALILIALTVSLAASAHAQGPTWHPPSKEMPLMPRMVELSGDWFSARAGWFDGVEEISRVAPGRLRAEGESRAGSEVAAIVRFLSDPLPVVVWSDRNRDLRADLIEIYRTGGVIIQLIDADYDGRANVMRVYDASGRLLREDRM